MGVAFFKDHPNALYPFTSMDARQLAYVEEVVTSCMQWHKQRDADLNIRGISSSTCCVGGAGHDSTADKNIIGSSCNVVMQMGGGCVLYVAGSSASNCRAKEGCGVILDARGVLETLCDCIFSSSR